MVQHLDTPFATLAYAVSCQLATLDDLGGLKKPPKNQTVCLIAQVESGLVHIERIDSMDARDGEKRRIRPGRVDNVTQPGQAEHALHVFNRRRLEAGFSKPFLDREAFDRMVVKHVDQALEVPDGSGLEIIEHGLLIQVEMTIDRLVRVASIKTSQRELDRHCGILHSLIEAMLRLDLSTTSRALSFYQAEDRLAWARS